MEPYGPEALAAFKQAAHLVLIGEYEAALAVEMLPSDRELIDASLVIIARPRGKLRIE